MSPHQGGPSITGPDTANAEGAPPGPPDREHTRTWRSPQGIGAIASVAAVLVAIAAIVIGGGSGGEGATPPTTPATTSTPDSAAYFFVYGTSMPGHLRYPEIEEFVADASPDRVTGRLYDTGSGFPAAVFGGDQAWIEGYRLEIREGRDAEARRVMTTLESGLYEPVTIETEDGFEATAYEWIGSVDGFEELDGRWDRPER